MNMLSYEVYFTQLDSFGKIRLPQNNSYISKKDPLHKKFYEKIN